MIRDRVSFRITPQEAKALEALTSQGASPTALFRELLKERAVEQGLWDDAPPAPSVRQLLSNLQQAIGTLCKTTLPKEVRPSLVPPPEISPDDLNSLFK